MPELPDLTIVAEAFDAALRGRPIESVRAQMSAQHAAASKRLSQASIEAARVLTPEQRAKIGEVMKKRMARHAARKAG